MRAPYIALVAIKTGGRRYEIGDPVTIDDADLAETLLAKKSIARTPPAEVAQADEASGKRSKKHT